MVTKNDNASCRIFIIDDTPANVEVLSKTLTLAGYNIAIANSGVKALAIIDRVKPDLILLDVMMPELDGFDTCKKLKSNDSTKDIPVIFITAKTDVDDIARGFHVGAVDYIAKPFNDEEVRARVNTHLQLKHSQLELIKLNEHKDKILGMAAHDLRSPLSLIIGFSELLQIELGSNISKNAVKLLDSTLRASRTMKSLIDDLLDSAAISKCTLALNAEKGDLSLLVRELKDAAEMSANAKNISIDIVADDVVECTFDTLRIAQVLENLMSNAVKYSPTNSRISLEVSARENFAHVIVSDEGPGFSSEDLSLMFRDFQTLSAKPTGGETSTGLGLAICKRVVDAHSGIIMASNNDHKGARFTLKLPIAA